MQYWHNPRCSKSRQALALLNDEGHQPEVYAYLDSPPSPADLTAVIAKLGLSHPRELMRTKEAVYKELDLKNETDEAALIQAMSDHPKLIERPILINGDTAAIGRPVEAILKAL